MRLTDILKPQNILIPLQAPTKNDAIGQLVSLLSKNGDVQDSKAVLDAVDAARAKADSAKGMD